MLDTLGQYLNFTYETMECGQVWGSRAPNGSFLGILGKIETGEADLGASEVSLTYDRAQHFDYAQVHGHEALTFVTGKIPPKLPSMSLAIIRPFTLPVWLVLAASLVLVSLLTKFIMRSQLGLRWIFFNNLAHVFDQRESLIIIAFNVNQIPFFLIN